MDSEEEGEEEEEEGKQDVPGMVEDDSERGIVPGNNDPSPTNPPSHTVKVHDQDLEIYYMAKLD